MNRNDFLRMIGNSGPSDRQSVAEVNELISVFPYFQSAYLLLLKGLHNISDVKFENQLRKYAIHIADREVLYYMLRDKKEIQDEVMAGKPSEVESAPVQEDPADHQQTVIESAKNSQELINEIEKDSVEGEAGTEGEEHKISLTSESDPEGDDATILIIDDESGDVTEKIVYMDPGFSTGGETELLELDTLAGNTAGQNEAEQPSSVTEGPAKKRSVKEIQSELIDRFIDANPRIEPVREKTDKPQEDISKPFTETRSGFVTETLASIYVSQGYFSRAIEIYEKLCLKYPEKSSYFASQIEKVKELIKK